jgi:2-phosphosulfolactate phosphatase
LHNYAVVAVDVFRATSTIATAIETGRRCFPVNNLEGAFELARKLPNPLLIGETNGVKPKGFDLNNSPAKLARRGEVERPAVLLSSSGAKLICQAATRHRVYVASLRNFTAHVDYLAANHDKVAVLGAGTRGEFRREDQLCCAWIAEGLVQRGFTAHDSSTEELIDRWSGKPVTAISAGRSAQFLRESDQLEDLNFILEHVDDLDQVLHYESGEITTIQLIDSATLP